MEKRDAKDSGKGSRLTFILLKHSWNRDADLLRPTLHVVL